MAAHHGWHGIWEEFQNEEIEVPSLIVVAVQYLKMHGDDPHGRPVVPVHGSLRHQSWPGSNALVEVAMALAHWIQWAVEASWDYRWRGSVIGLGRGGSQHLAWQPQMVLHWGSLACSRQHPLRSSQSTQHPDRARAA
jgi:hypothetical protein